MKRRARRLLPQQLAWNLDRGLIVDLFAGGGGASVGIEAALNTHVDIAVNHNQTALAVHRVNHPRTHHFIKDVWEVDPLKATNGLPVWLLWASPDCKHFSRAKGAKPVSKKIRMLAWVINKWARKTRPAIICGENVPEFVEWGPVGKDHKPIKSRKGETFRRWVRDLEALGYRVEWRVLDASHYGAPTKRRRLFFVARRDGKPIVWPEPTHGPGLLPFRTAAECIDWSIPCPSIFERKKPLAEKTLARIADGIRRYVLQNPKPFIVKVNHGNDDRTGSRVHNIDAPLSTITAKSRGHAVVVPTLIQAGYGERPGQRPRSLNLHEPLGTVVAQGKKHALVAAFLAKHYGGVVGQKVDQAIGTITSRDHHSLAAVTLATFRGTGKRQTKSSSVEAPLPVISAGGVHVAEVRAFLIKYHSSGGQWADVSKPLSTITTRDRLGLVTVHGVDYQIVDIGMRMLKPVPELLRAQFGRFAAGYDLSAAKTEEAKTMLIGNSVCPEMAEALVAAQAGREPIRRAA